MDISNAKFMNDEDILQKPKIKKKLTNFTETFSVWEKIIKRLKNWAN